MRTVRINEILSALTDEQLSIGNGFSLPSTDGVARFCAIRLLEYLSNAELLNRDPERWVATFGEIGTAYANYLQTGEAQVLLSNVIVPGRRGVIVVQEDVSNIVLTIKRISQKYEIPVLLHPILQEGKKSISCIYFELQTEDNIKTSIIERLQSSFILLQTLSREDERIKHSVTKIIDQARQQSSGLSEEKVETVVSFLELLLKESIILTVGDNKSSEGVSSEALGVAPAFQEICDLFRRGDKNFLVRLIPHPSTFWGREFLKVAFIRFENATYYIVFDVANGNTRGYLFSIPEIYQKVRRLINGPLEIKYQSYRYFQLVDAIGNMPFDWLWRASDDLLASVIDTTLRSQEADKPAIIYEQDSDENLNRVCVVFANRTLSARQRHKVLTLVVNAFGQERGNNTYVVNFDEVSNDRVKLYIDIQGDIGERGISKLENDLAAVTMGWEESLSLRLLNSGLRLSNYDESLKYSFTPDEAFKVLNALPDEGKTVASFLDSVNHQPSFTHPSFVGWPDLVVIASGEIKFKKIKNVLESFGFELESNTTTTITCNARLYTIIRIKYTIDDRLISGHMTSGVIENLMSGCIDSKRNALLIENLEFAFKYPHECDVLNRLAFAGIPTQGVFVIRSYVNMLWQYTRSPSVTVLMEALVSNWALSVKLWEIFEYRFSPTKIHFDAYTEAIESFKVALQDVADVTFDKALRLMLNLLVSTVRTNLYTARFTDTIALKVKDADLEFLRDPRPLFEVFVYGPSIQGVHIRMGKVARGGLRISDRRDDYRTEVLDLVKTQAVKNVVIVPVGAKGGFVVKHEAFADNLTRDEINLTSYQTFIRSLLSLVDNLVGEDTVTPEGLIRYDEVDPYFVVAADKGTASYSNVANNIAISEFDFWLRDGFASGGSDGYDHKGLGVTAKGAWYCVERHFKDLGFDFQNEPIVTVGIGDMSGDVFGNGMLLSRQIQLVAAFNHLHIFLDPNPDTFASYKERERLFKTKGSKWSDYSPSLISKGGGVFRRSEKAISISKEVAERFKISAGVLSGEELIRAVLSSPCDLLWNGGIGTYVKASTETHADANDSVNDSVRVDASELRARVVGEGGNLGFTTAARIEFSRLGGKINSDAVDNSGGVATSDLEVNLKILFADSLAQGKIDVKVRNSLLHEISDEVCAKVFAINKSQSLAVTLAESRSKISGPYYQSLINELGKQGYIFRSQLPSETEISEMIHKGLPFSRPLLAICLAGVKMQVKRGIIGTNLVKQELLDSYLNLYFPEQVTEKYPELVKHHSLRDEIIATQVTNSLVDNFGITFFHRMVSNYGVTVVEIVEYGILSALLFGLNDVIELVKPFDGVDTPKYLELMHSIGKTLRDMTEWFITKEREAQVGFVSLYNSYNELFKTHFTPKYCENLRRGDISSVGEVQNVLEIIRCSMRGGNQLNYDQIDEIYHVVSELLYGEKLINQLNNIKARSKWELQLISICKRDLALIQSELTINFVKSKIYDVAKITNMIVGASGYSDLKDLITEDQETQSSPARCVVLNDRLNRLASKII